jgi:chromosome segregation ATPase
MEQLDLNNLSVVISYLVSVVVGSVGYKYVSRWWDKRSQDQNHEVSYSKLVIESLIEQMQHLTTRITDLEKENRAYHLREIEVTRQLATAQSEVDTLRKEIHYLKETQSELVTKVEFYKQQNQKIT